MIAKFLELDRPTASGRIYTRSIVEAALEDWKKTFNTEVMPIFKAPTATPQVADIVGEASNIRVEDGFLIGDVGFYEKRIEEVFPPEKVKFHLQSVQTDQEPPIQ
jgi:hypothetical protein